MTLLAYRFAVDPTPRQERALRAHAGAARVAFNWGLARVKANLDQLARALKNWSGSKRGKRKGRAVGFPRFRPKRQARPSIRFTTGAIRCEPTHAVLPRLGRIKLHERADLGDARILSVSVRFARGRWFVAFTVEQDVTRPAPARPDVVAGVDLGIKTLAVVAAADGEVYQVPNPRHLNRSLRKVRRLSRTVSGRQGPDRRTGQRPSSRWRRADAARNRALGKVTDQRRDAIHKLGSHLAARFGAVAVEDPHVAGMVRNRRLARHVADASFAEIRRQLEYKTIWHGGSLIAADRWFASSKTCSGCGAVKTKLALSERTFTCGTCGLVADRDLNAAINLAAYGERVLAGSGPDSNGRGAQVGPEGTAR